MNATQPDLGLIPKGNVWVQQCAGNAREIGQRYVVYAIYLAQRGDKHLSAKPLKGLGSGVLEVVSDHRGDTFRSVYTVRLAERVL